MLDDGVDDKSLSEIRRESKSAKLECLPGFRLASFLPEESVFLSRLSSPLFGLASS